MRRLGIGAQEPGMARCNHVVDELGNQLHLSRLYSSFPGRRAFEKGASAPRRGRDLRWRAPLAAKHRPQTRLGHKRKRGKHAIRRAESARIVYPGNSLSTCLRALLLGAYRCDTSVMPAKRSSARKGRSQCMPGISTQTARRRSSDSQSRACLDWLERLLRASAWARLRRPQAASWGPGSAKRITSSRLCGRDEGCEDQRALQPLKESLAGGNCSSATRPSPGRRGSQWSRTSSITAAP